MDKNKLVDAYSHLMEEIYKTMDESLHSMADIWDAAETKLQQAGDYTLEDIELISAALKRDIEGAAHGLPDKPSTRSLSEWFKFDISLLENFALDAFLSIADKTRIQLAKLGEEAKHHSYQSGTLTLPGTFECNQCKKIIAFKSTCEIPSCPVCQGQTFSRV